MTSLPRLSESAPTIGRRWALVALCVVQFMLVLDDTVVNVALPSIRADLGFGPAALAWVVNAYFLAFGGLLLLFGRLADLLGRRSVFLCGVAVFGVASLCCGIAQEPWQLVIARFVQGSGAAMAAPAALSLITLLFPEPAERAKALGIWGGIAALGATLGLVISGVLTELASWRWIFLINLPVAAVALILLPRLLPESRAAAPGRLDVPGAVLGTAAVLSLVYGLLRAGETGWDFGVATALASAGALFAAFLIAESRVAEPLVPKAFLTLRVRAVANVATLLFSAAMYAMAFLLMIHLQTVLDYRPLVAGVAYLPYGAAILVGMWLSTRILLRIGLRWTLAASFALCAVGLLLLSGISAGDSYAADVLPGMLVTALSNGMALPILAVAAVSETTDRDAGLGSALFTSAQQIGGAIGISLLVTLATWRTGDPTAGYTPALVAAAALVAFGAALAAIGLRHDGAA
ncbi:MFS transporter [Nocardia sp. NPDC055321]